MPYAFITGAAKGIGRALATEMALRKYNLLLLDIDQDGLQDTARELSKNHQVVVHTLQLDLSAPLALETILHWSAPFHPQLTVVINNAGYGLNGAFEYLTLEEQLNIIDVNIKAQVSISHSFLPILRTQPRAWLLNVSSTTAYQTVPYLNIYAASKAFVLSFTRGLQYELKDSTISVSCLSPGSTDTDFVNRARMGAYIRKTAQRFNMTPQSVAQIAIIGLFRGQTEIIPGFSNRLNAWLPKFFPKRLVEKIAGKIYKPRGDQPHTPTKIVSLEEAI